MATAGPHRLLLLADRRGGARLADRLPAALPLLDGVRRPAGDAAGGDGLADRAPRRADAAGRTRVNALARRASCGVAPRPTRSPDEQGFWYRLSRFVMRRPVPIATLSALFLIVLGIPFLSIRFTAADPQILPKEASARQVYDTMQADFPPYRDTPIWVVVKGGGAGAGARARRPGAPGRWRRRSPATATAARRRQPGRGDLRRHLPLRGEPVDGRGDPQDRSSPAPPSRSAARPRTSSTSRAASPSTCRSLWGSSSWRPWSSSS